MAQFVFPPVSVTIDYQAADAAGALPSQLAIIGGYSGTAIKAVKVDGTGQIMVGASALPTGAATAALQSDGNALLTTISTKDFATEATLGTIDTDTGNIATSTASIATNTTGLNSCVDAGTSHLNVDIVTQLPSGTNNIGDVDVLSVVPGYAATNLGKRIQDAQGATDTGVAALVVRNDTLADLAGADHDYAPLQVNATGALYTDVTGVLPGVAATNLGKAIQSPQGATDVGVAALVVRNDTLADLAGADHDYAPLQVNATGALYTSLATAIPAGTATIGKVDINSYVWKEGLDSSTYAYVTNDIWDTSGTQALSSTAIIPVATLANDIKEIQTVEDIGEFVGLYSGTNLQAILPLGGGTVKINLPSTTVVGLKSLTGTDITSGKIAINFLG